MVLVGEVANLDKIGRLSQGRDHHTGLDARPAPGNCDDEHLDLRIRRWSPQARRPVLLLRL